MKKASTFALMLLISGVFFVNCNKKTVKPEPDPINLSFTVQHASTINTADGAIDLQVEGGAAPFDYLWSNGAQTEDLAGLVPGMYSVTVVDDEGQWVSDSVFVNSLDRVGTVTDVDGNVYQTVKIGNQWWMAENLRVTHDAQGNAITSYVYGGDQSTIPVYGRYYTWHNMMNGETQEGAQGIAPDGWHMPTDDEWQALFDFLGGIGVAGAKLKTVGHKHWIEVTNNATNETGFSALPAGGGYPNGMWEGVGYGTHYWSSTSRGNQALAPTVHCDPDILMNVTEKTNRFSIRCVKDR
jgi:uncharacterized protein (TIGR02145 family)